MASKGIEQLKFALFSIITLSLLGIFGYWSVATIQSGTEHANKQKIETLSKENEDLKTEVSLLTSELGVAKSKLEKLEEPEAEPVVIAEKAPEKNSAQYQTLIDELQKMVDAKVLLKEKSVGPRVGTVQKFLNIYNDTNTKIDNGYGPGTASLVEKFQRDVGLSPDGEAGPSTFLKMIEWLKKQ